ncbi:MAG: SusC/RagA family TonB-linked outer membrane protein [Gemmatimonadaceae bacterium]|nr:SusC/RagA family TonB-linked outer membrane protein [Gemmatimonadaceae bacterium]
MTVVGRFTSLAAAAGCLLGTVPAIAFAQGTTLNGRVTAGANGVAVVAATVSIAELRVGTQTDADGRYSFTVPASSVRGQAVFVTARRIGYQPSTVQVTLSGTGIVTDFRLTSVAATLDEVVVTALGIERKKSVLGTAQQQISSAELNQTKSQNVINQLQGKVSGVNITGSGTQGGSNRIVLRGANSINGNNSPVFIIDGVAISNRARVGNPVGGYDFGSAIADINPDDIESVSILKGPNAAALYGSRAANGVIVMTTKKGGSTNNRIRMEVTTSYTWDKPSVLPSFQNLYGQGAGGSFKYVDGQGGGDCDNCDQSYGPRLDGRPIDQFTGKQQPWIAHPDNVKDFFNTGHTKSTTVAVSGGNDRASARVSVGADNVEGYVPNNTFHKTSGLLNASLKVNSRLSTDANLQYVRNTGANRPGVGYTNGLMQMFVWFGRQVDMEALRDYNKGGATNGGPSDREYNWNYNYHNNPFWLQFQNPLSDTRDRFIGRVAANYRIADGINASLSSGSDIYRFNIDQRWAQGQITGSPVDQSYFGAFSLINDYNNENNTNLVVTANRQLGSRLSLNATGGGGIRRELFSTTGTTVTGITVPNIYNVANAAVTPSLTQSLSRRQVNSVYGSAAFTLNDWWTVEGTARNDWSSTLPQGANSYFYPSANTSLILTDAIPSLKGRLLSYAKLRASTARVGNDADPYQLRTTYTGLSTKLNGLPQFTLGDALANAELKPEITHSNEIGTELGFLDGRITFDASVYQKYTRNQIFNAPVSTASGFTAKSVNAGKITNNGFEALLGMTPVQTDNGLAWNTTLNYSRNKSKVTELAPGVTTLLLGSLWNGRIEARLGEAYGAIYGKGFQRDSATGKLLLSDGLPQPTATPTVLLGNIQPKWTGGWANTISYRNVTLYGLLDVKRGGNVYSVTNMFGDNTGVLARTLKGREEDWDKPGVVVEGIDADTGLPNTTRVTSEQYHQAIYPSIEPYVYDAGYVKLREMRIGYDLPLSLSNRLNVSAISLAVTGRNLRTWTKVPNIDPEFSYTTGNYQGIEFAAFPNARSWGLSFRITP